MDKKSNIEDLLQQSRNTKFFVDSINLAYYGMTWEDYIKILCGKKEDDNNNDA